MNGSRKIGACSQIKDVQTGKGGGGWLFVRFDLKLASYSGKNGGGLGWLCCVNFLEKDNNSQGGK